MSWYALYLSSAAKKFLLNHSKFAPACMQLAARIIRSGSHGCARRNSPAPPPQLARSLLHAIQPLVPMYR
eukprot:441983-Hanusia_phi.AAC.2